MVLLEFFTVVLWSTQPVTEMSTRDISWGQSQPVHGAATLPPSCANCLEIWEPQPPGTLRVCPGLELLYLYLTILYSVQLLMWVSFENMICFMLPTVVSV